MPLTDALRHVLIPSAKYIAGAPLPRAFLHDLKAVIGKRSFATSTVWRQMTDKQNSARDLKSKGELQNGGDPKSEGELQSDGELKNKGKKIKGKKDKGENNVATIKGYWLTSGSKWSRDKLEESVNASWIFKKPTILREKPLHPYLKWFAGSGDYENMVDYIASRQSTPTDGHTNNFLNSALLVCNTSSVVVGTQATLVRRPKPFGASNCDEEFVPEQTLEKLKIVAYASQYDNLMMSVARDNRLGGFNVTRMSMPTPWSGPGSTLNVTSVSDIKIWKKSHTAHLDGITVYATPIALANGVDLQSHKSLTTRSPDPISQASLQLLMSANVLAELGLFVNDHIIVPAIIDQDRHFQIVIGKYHRSAFIDIAAGKCPINPIVYQIYPEQPLDWCLEADRYQILQLMDDVLYYVSTYAEDKATIARMEGARKTRVASIIDTYMLYLKQAKLVLQ